VITSEQIYLEAARCTIQELIESGDYCGAKDYFGSSLLSSRHFQPIEAVISPRLVTALKTRAINSNWDLCYLGACLHIAGILHETQYLSTLDRLDRHVSLERILLTLRGAPLTGSLTAAQGEQTVHAFLSALDSDSSASPLDAVSGFIERQLGTRFTCLEPRNQLWTLCFEIFQEWMHQDRGSRYAASMPPMAFKEETIVDAGRLLAALTRLRRSGCVLGIATGRPRKEAIPPLENAGILSCFDPERIITYDDVLEAESFLMAQGSQMKLGKPHPFVIRKAISPHASLLELTSPDGPAASCNAVMIGDSTADIIAAKRAGCFGIGVLTGLGWDENSFEIKRSLLLSSGCDTVANSVLDLPSLLGAADSGQVK